MPLEPGTTLGPYAIVAPLGAGGMGEVYRARDSRLDRPVAIKVLPAHLTENAELRRRFEQEARAVSRLNHPHICTLHDIGQENGVDFMVMELLEGETLADRLHRGELSLEQALEYARQIADALDEAHRHDIVHRDLKPGNVFLIRSGVKLLDFGLAKLHERKEARETSSVLTQEKPLTEQGAILGTFQYMAPEQLEGGSVDARCDLFAFGAVLYEMLTGRKAFQGKSQASLIGAILHTDPPAVSELRPLAPRSLDRLVRKCLRKDPDARWQTARDLKDELRWIEESGGDGDRAPGARASSPLTKFVLGALAGALVAALVMSLVPRTASPPAGLVMRSVIELPAGETLQPGSGPNIALSPDGTMLAFRARGTPFEGPLFVRRLSELDATRVGEAVAGDRLRFTPDGQWIASVHERNHELRKVSIRDGTEVLVAAGVQQTPFDWAPDGRIVATGPGDEGLVIVPAEGRTPLPLTTVDRDQGEREHVFPQFLPGGGVLFTIVAGANRFEDTRIAVVSPETGDIRVIQAGGSFARYAPTGGVGEPGHLLFLRPGVLFAAPFDPESLTLQGSAVPVITGVSTMGGGMGEIAYSKDGTLVYAPGTAPGQRQLIEVDAAGNEKVILPERRGYGAPSYSPDGKRLALTVETESEANVAIYDLERGTLTPVTFEGRNLQAVWSPDGARIVFASDRAGAFNLYVRPADGSGSAERLTTSESQQIPYSWSPDGRHIAFVARAKGTRAIWTLSMDDRATERLSGDIKFDEDQPMFSPDGRWLAYTQDQNPRSEVWIRPFPRGTPVRVSIDGGIYPVWAPSGEELYFLYDAVLMRARLRTAPELRVEQPIPVSASFHVPVVFTHKSFTLLRAYDVFPDGTRFVMNKASGRVDRLHLVTNWFRELRELAPRN